MNFFEKFHLLKEKKKSLLCVGIDPEFEQMPPTIRREDDFLFLFCRSIIEATAPYAVAFKFNFAFFEVFGATGWETMARLRRIVPRDCLTIADAKRGDINHSSQHYARAILDNLGFDGVTVNPYLGFDGAEPFLNYTQKGIFFLCHTSNPGAQDLQYFPAPENPLYRHVARKVASWNKAGNCGIVVGGTWPDRLAELRRLVPDLPFLVPGVGSQGGHLQSVLHATGDTNMLIAISRSIIFAGQDADFAEAAQQAAASFQQEMQKAFGGSGA